ncbi:Hypothetical predicted protein [Olea europaea subsp. europaea]|uniref:Uncharacterized protein n=1 Tax=Olea europaea subsp. europaea TaxID=158383 RepID=A0A8S0QCF3_OLEEU|nr:Hypothetical predicted protein [Olea europaea subsp. europaea]
MILNRARASGRKLRKRKPGWRVSAQPWGPRPSAVAPPLPQQCSRRRNSDIRFRWPFQHIERPVLLVLCHMRTRRKAPMHPARTGARIAPQEVGKLPANAADALPLAVHWLWTAAAAGVCAAAAAAGPGCVRTHAKAFRDCGVAGVGWGEACSGAYGGPHRTRACAQRSGGPRGGTGRACGGRTAAWVARGSPCLPPVNTERANEPEPSTSGHKPPTRGASASCVRPSRAALRELANLCLPACTCFGVCVRVGCQRKRNRAAGHLAQKLGRGPPALLARELFHLWHSNGVYGKTFPPVRALGSFSLTCTS